ncbi:unnamed protein product [Amoebophrya sp. A120]|nr:unnamed protein product [Amoebophrya sp. A120]|eukprot:GSA120T00003588001.1
MAAASQETVARRTNSCPGPPDIEVPRIPSSSTSSADERTATGDSNSKSTTSSSSGPPEQPQQAQGHDHVEIAQNNSSAAAGSTTRRSTNAEAPGASVNDELQAPSVVAPGGGGTTTSTTATSSTSNATGGAIMTSTDVARGQQQRPPSAPPPVVAVTAPPFIPGAMQHNVQNMTTLVGGNVANSAATNVLPGSSHLQQVAPALQQHSLVSSVVQSAHQQYFAQQVVQQHQQQIMQQQFLAQQHHQQSQQQQMFAPQQSHHQLFLQQAAAGVVRGPAVGSANFGGAPQLPAAPAFPPFGDHQHLVPPMAPRPPSNNSMQPTGPSPPTASVASMFAAPPPIGAMGGGGASSTTTTGGANASVISPHPSMFPSHIGGGPPPGMLSTMGMPTSSGGGPSRTSTGIIIGAPNGGTSSTSISNAAIPYFPTPPCGMPPAIFQPQAAGGSLFPAAPTAPPPSNGPIGAADVDKAPLLGHGQQNDSSTSSCSFRPTAVEFIPHQITYPPVLPPAANTTIVSNLNSTTTLNYGTNRDDLKGIPKDMPTAQPTLGSMIIGSEASSSNQNVVSTSSQQENSNHPQPLALKISTGEIKKFVQPALRPQCSPGGGPTTSSSKQKNDNKSSSQTSVTGASTAGSSNAASSQSSGSKLSSTSPQRRPQLVAGAVSSTSFGNEHSMPPPPPAPGHRTGEMKTQQQHQDTRPATFTNFNAQAIYQHQQQQRPHLAGGAAATGTSTAGMNTASSHSTSSSYHPAGPGPSASSSSMQMQHNCSGSGTSGNSYIGQQQHQNQQQQQYHQSNMPPNKQLMHQAQRSQVRKFQETSSEYNDFCREFSGVMKLQNENLYGTGRDLNITERAVARWTEVNATDEFVQNWHDQTILMIQNSHYYRSRVDVDSIRLQVLKGDARNRDLMPMNNRGGMDQHNEWGSAEWSGDQQGGGGVGPGASSSTCWNNRSGAGGAGAPHNCAPYQDNASTPQRFRAVFLADDWQDERVSHKLSLLDFDPQEKELTLINYSSVLPPRAFAAGHTGNEKLGQHQKRAKGKFGDGLQSACSVFARKGKHIRIDSAPGYQYTFQYQLQAGLDSVYTLHYKLSGTSEVCTAGGGDGFGLDCGDDFNSATDTRVRLRGANFDRQRYLFLNPEDMKDRCFRPFLRQKEMPNKYEILRGPCLRNRIYVKGMLVQQPHLDDHGARIALSKTDKYFGYNLLEFDMKSRDRENSIDMSQERHAIVHAWHEVLCKAYVDKSERSQREHEERARVLFRAFERAPECFECSVIGSCPDRYGNEIRQKMWEYFKSYYQDPKRCAAPGMPVAHGNDSRKKLIKRCGYNPVQFHSSLCNMLASFLPDLEQEWLSKRAVLLEQESEDVSQSGKMIKDIATGLFGEFFRKRIEEAKHAWNVKMPPDVAKSVRVRGVGMKLQGGGGINSSSGSTTSASSSMWGGGPATSAAFSPVNLTVKVVHSRNRECRSEVASLSGDSLNYFSLSGFPTRGERLDGVYEVRENQVMNNVFTAWQITNPYTKQKFPVNPQGNAAGTTMSHTYVHNEQHFLYNDYGKWHLNYANKFSRLGNFRDSRPLASCIMGFWHSKDTNGWIENTAPVGNTFKGNNAKGKGKQQGGGGVYNFGTANNGGAGGELNSISNSNQRGQKEVKIDVCSMFDPNTTAHFCLTINTSNANGREDDYIAEFNQKFVGAQHQQQSSAVHTVPSYQMFWQEMVNQVEIECGRLRWYMSKEEKKCLMHTGLSQLCQGLGIQTTVQIQTMQDLLKEQDLDKDDQDLQNDMYYNEDDDNYPPEVPPCWDDDDYDDEFPVGPQEQASSSSRIPTGANNANSKEQNTTSGNKKDLNKVDHDEALDQPRRTASNANEAMHDSSNPLFEIPNMKDANGKPLVLTREQLEKKKVVRFPINDGTAGAGTTAADADKKKITSSQRHAYESYDLAQTLADTKYNHKNDLLGENEQDNGSEDANNSEVIDRNKMNSLNVPHMNKCTRELFRSIFNFDPTRPTWNVVSAKTVRVQGENFDAGVGEGTATGSASSAAVTAGAASSSSSSSSSYLSTNNKCGNISKGADDDPRVPGSSSYIELDVIPAEGKPFWQNTMLDVLRAGQGKPILRNPQEQEEFRKEQLAQLDEALRVLNAWREQIADGACMEAGGSKGKGKKSSASTIASRMGMGIPDGEQRWHTEIGLRDDRSRYPAGYEPESDEEDEQDDTSDEEEDEEEEDTITSAEEDITNTTSQKLQHQSTVVNIDAEEITLPARTSNGKNAGATANGDVAPCDSLQHDGGGPPNTARSSCSRPKELSPVAMTYADRLKMSRSKTTTTSSKTSTSASNAPPASVPKANVRPNTNRITKEDLGAWGNPDSD